MDMDKIEQNDANEMNRTDTNQIAGSAMENQELATAKESNINLGSQHGKLTVRSVFALRRAWFILALLSSIICLVSSILHYTHRYYGNPVTWISWLTGLLFLFIAVCPSREKIRQKLAVIPNKTTYIFGALAAFFILSHFWNFSTAPWNQNGLFDDAAWDIYFAKTYIFSGAPFQPAFPDFGIAREVMFHYYITFWFKLFGYNLLTFNISLIVLGLITFLFTCLLIQKLFNNYTVTIAAGVILNFLPLHYVHTFAGHRYAAAAPLIMSSLYFLYTGFKGRSSFRIVVSAMLAAFCVDSAIMGKQYLMGILAAFLLIFGFHFKRYFSRINWNLAKLFGASLIVAMMPLLVYICYNPIYFVHESNMTRTFLDAFRSGGWNGIKPYYDQTWQVFFGDFTYKREFIWEFVLIPFSYYAFLIPGVMLALLRKRYEMVLLAVIPIGGAFVAGCYDFRVLHAAPFWIILMAFTFHEIMKLTSRYRNKIIKITGLAVISGVLLAGLIPCIGYIHGKSKDPNSIWLLPQKDVALSRYLRDIVAGVPDPSPRLRYQEFNKLQGYPEPDYDTLICQYLGFAITHMFLKDYDDRKIMAFSDQTPFNLQNESEILQNNKNAIFNYPIGTKDLKLIWEVQDKTSRIIEAFKRLNFLGCDEILTSEHAGQSFSFYVLTVKNENIGRLKQETAKIQL